MDRDRRFLEGVRLFNRGDYHEGHEFWEEVWREDPTPQRLFYQGLIQVCAGLLHLEWGHRRGSRNHYERSTDKLRRFPPDHLGVDVAGLLARFDWIFHPDNVDKYLGRKLEGDEAPKLADLAGSSEPNDPTRPNPDRPQSSPGFSEGDLDPVTYTDKLGQSR